MKNKVYKIFSKEDVFAGISVAAIALPAQMATANLAGFPVIYGLYVFVASTLGFFLLGNNRYLSGGADSTIAPIFATGLTVFAVPYSVHYMELASLLSLLVGAILMIVYLFKLGWLSNLLSYPVTVGFLAGISIHIIIGQLSTVLNIPVNAHSPIVLLYRLFSHILELNIISSLIGFGVFLFVFFATKIYKKMPSALIALLFCILIEVYLNKFNINIETLSDPKESELTFNLLSLPFHDILHLIPLALLISMVCIIQTSAVSNTVKDRNEIPDFNKDFAGIGLGCIFSGVIGGFPCNASPGRSNIIQRTGARSKWSALFSGIAIFIVIIFADEFFGLIPKAALSGVLIYVGLSIFNFSEIKRFYIQNKNEYYLCLSTIFMITILPIDAGVILSILVSLIHSFFIITRPNCEELLFNDKYQIWGHHSLITHNDGFYIKDDIAVIHLSSPLYFTTYPFFEEYINNIVKNRASLRLIIIDSSSISDIDITAIDKILILNRNLSHRNIKLLFSNIEHERFIIVLNSSKLLDKINQKGEYDSINDAVEEFEQNI
ncbi:SulP family inorganic anion transporter [Photobacterium damselae]|uniref:SulP family inorganic anion transporter n=1 Tax=Photobacterium damselae TaxID=38293 RepID=UPI001EEE34F7|nr:SulP family inorganic anion transporter [Photobacterium damselae]UKA12009.1 STAS domain-containing protein [Photobacterium damselae subsp. damselae]